MLQSMTGFGEAQCEAKGMSFLVEIKTLNNRFLKTLVKLPDALAFTEPEVERIIREELGRGSITYLLHMRDLNDGGGFQVNQAAVRKYIQSLEQILTLHNQGKVQIDLASILQLPGTCEPRQYGEEEHQFFQETVKTLTHQALKQLRQMRIEEGKSLRSDLKHQCQQIEEHLSALAEMAGTVVDSYRQRVEKRVNEMLAGMDLKIEADMLVKEVALFADRSDINEEITRLRSHLEQFDETCEAEERAGRRLDFLSQEMLREANTIGSKANHAGISHRVVEIKVAIERLREQVQNIE